MARARGLEELPAVCVVADVCREELLFEIDAEAVVKTGFKDSRGRGDKDRVQDRVQGAEGPRGRVRG
jgi:hypothetical protein